MNSMRGPLPPTPIIRRRGAKKWHLQDEKPVALCGVRWNASERGTAYFASQIRCDECLIAAISPERVSAGDRMPDLLLGHGRRPPSKSVAPRAVPIGEGRLFRWGSYTTRFGIQLRV